MQTYSFSKAYDLKTMRVLVSGSSGMVGRRACSFLASASHDVWTLQRGHSDISQKIIGWDPAHDGAEISSFEGFDAVLHLAGENIGDKRWSKKQKNKIFQSRCRDTWLLSQLLSRLSKPPKVFLSASAVGIYGDRKEEQLTEDSSLGNDFLSDVCMHWEEASGVLRQSEIRTVALRFGYILSAQGGLLKKVLPLFRWGLGGRMGSGRQIMPWIALEDVVRAIYHCLAREDISGAVNIVAPKPVSQTEFAKTLARALRRPAFLWVPAGLLRIALGERADALILRSVYALPKKLEASGFTFQYDDLARYFREIL